MEKSVEFISKEIDRLASILETAKKNKATLEGRLEESMDRLKKEFGFDSLEDAQSALSELEEQIENMSVDINQKFQKLQEKYEW
jgi:predicted  nucleic acid-binding Zn-ribbon protein